MFSVWGGMIALALLYTLARRLFDPYVALVALGIMTVNLRAILLARSVTSESWVPLYTLLTLLVLVIALNLRHEIRFRTPQTLPFTLLAILFGGSGYLHYSILILGPIGALFFIHLLITHQPISRRMWSVGIYVLVLATVVAVPYLISSVREWETSELHPLWTQRPQSLSDVVNGAFSALGAMIWEGDPRATHNLPSSPLVGPAVSILLIIGVIAAIRRWRQPRYALILIVLGAGLFSDTWIGTGPNFTANLVALPAVYILAGIGVRSIWRWLHARHPLEASWQPVLAAVLVIFAVNIASLPGRLFDDWRNRESVKQAYHANLGYLAAYLDRTPDDLPVSMCSLPLRGTTSVGLSSRQILQLMMHRENLDIRHSDCRSGLVFINAGAPMRFVFADLAYRDQMRPELLEWLEDSTPIHVDRVPDGAVLRVDVEERIENAGGVWQSLPAYFMPEQDNPIDPAQLPVTFENNLTLAGYDIRGGRVPGDDSNPAVIITYWRVDGELPPTLGFFAQMLDYWEDPDNGDQVPVTGAMAETYTIDVIPSNLHNRDIVVQVLYVGLSKYLEPKDYAVVVGAYNGAIEQHIGVLDRETGTLRGDWLWLGTIELQEP
jgi:hypothetical protein